MGELGLKILELSVGLLTLRNIVDEAGEYFSMRALQEQIAARNATCEAARSRHDEISEMYRLRAAILNEPAHCCVDVLKENLVS